MNHKASARSAVSESDPFEALRRIGHRTRTFIRIPHVKDLVNMNAFHLEAAKRELTTLVRQTQTRQPGRARNGSSSQRTMPTVHPVSERAKRDMMLKFEARTRLELYRQEPESVDDFLFTGMFLWPVNDIHPDQIFGTSHATLDDLRTFHSVFITYDRQSSIFKILTNDIDGNGKVEEVITKLRVAFCEYAASKCVPLEIYLVSPPESKDAKANVRMIDSDLRLKAGFIPPSDPTTALRGVPKSAELAGADLPGEEKSKWNVQAAKTIARNERLTERALLKTLQRAVYLRGRIQMRAHFGLFVFNKYVLMNDARGIPTAEFIHNIRDPKTKGSLQQVLLTKEEVENVFKEIWDATDLFVPLDSSSDTLKDVKPFHSAWFQFGYGQTQYLKLQLEASPIRGYHSVHEIHEITQRHWTKHNRIAAAPLQMYMIPLQKGITWKMQIAADGNIKDSELPISLTKFDAAVQLLAPSSSALEIGGTELMFEIPGREQFPNMDYDFQQKTAWRYRLQANGAYVFEIARYDKFALGRTPKQTGREPVFTQWGFSLWCVGWDEKLSENAALKIGEHANWTPSLEEFLPTSYQSQSTGPNAGFSDYLKMLQRIVEVLGKAITMSAPEADHNGLLKADSAPEASHNGLGMADLEEDLLL
ncbi:hypothetical protein MMC30_000895 [Trapelia coarctata]|nr:hypothetical protein [Trapelia coarctata]